MNRYDPILRLFKLLDDLPEDGYDVPTLFTHVCHVIGIPMEETGLSESAERTFGEMYWDYELDDLDKRLRQLFDEDEFEPRFLIGGILAYIRDHLNDWTDPDEVRRVIELNERLINRVMSGEDGRNMSAQEREELVRPARNFLDNIDTRIAQAERTLAALDELAAKLFSRQYWFMYDLRKLQGELTDDDEDESE